MAPAIVHFLVGAALLLLVAAPFAVRYEPVRRHGLTIATVGGLWGTAPDVHLVVPGDEGPLRTFHQSTWPDLFALHHTLDLPAVEAYGPGKVEFPTMLVFLGVAAVFTLAVEWGARYEFEPIGLRREMVGGTAGAALVSTVLLGGVLHLTGRIGAIGNLLGHGTAVAGWAAIGVGGALAAGVFAVCIELVTRDDVTLLTSTVFGSLVAVPTWLLATVLVVPLWKLRMFDAALETSPGDPALLIALMLAGGTLGATYVGIKRALIEGGPWRDDRLGRPAE